MGSCQSSNGGAVAQPSSASPAGAVAHPADKAAAPASTAKPAEASKHGNGVKASGEVHDKYQMGKALGS